MRVYTRSGTEAIHLIRMACTSYRVAYPYIGCAVARVYVCDTYSTQRQPSARLCSSVRLRSYMKPSQSLSAKSSRLFFHAPCSHVARCNMNPQSGHATFRRTSFDFTGKITVRRGASSWKSTCSDRRKLGVAIAVD